MKIPEHIFCQCMKPWKICANKKNSYKIDVRDLIDIYSLKPILNVGKGNIIHTKFNVNYDFVNKKWMTEKFNCRFLDNKLPPFDRR